MATQILWWHQNILQVSMALYLNFLPHRLSACCWSSLRPSAGGEMTWLRPTWRFPPPGPRSFSFSCYTTFSPPTSFLPPHLPAPPPPSHFPAPNSPPASPPGPAGMHLVLFHRLDLLSAALPPQMLPAWHQWPPTTTTCHGIYAVTARFVLNWQAEGEERKRFIPGLMFHHIWLWII